MKPVAWNGGNTSPKDFNIITTGEASGKNEKKTNPEGV